MKKIFFSLFISLLIAAPVHAGTFKDVSNNSPYYAALEYLHQKGVISGYPDGTFQEDKTINRAEALKIIFLGRKAVGFPGNPSNVNVSFPDVQSKDWFYGFVQQGLDAKIVEGYPDGTFKPENPINVAESLKIILIGFDAAVPSTLPDVNPYIDVDKTAWYARYAAFAKDKQLIASQEDGKLQADRFMTRAAFAEIVYRFMYTKEFNIDRFPLSTNWPSFSHPSQHYALKYPFAWQKIEAGSQTIFWKQDQSNGQMSFARIFPNSATVVVTVDQNKDQLALNDYLARIQYDSNALIEKQTLNNYPFASISIPQNGLRDYYFELPNKNILIVYSQNGDGPLKSQLQEEIRYLVGSIRYQETSGSSTGVVAASSDPRELLLSQIRSDLLVPKKGETLLNLLPDRVIIETDTIGIGTGPVDYYYSQKYNITLKYERNSDTVLTMKEGKTSAF